MEWKLFFDVPVRGLCAFSLHLFRGPVVYTSLYLLASWPFQGACSLHLFIFAGLLTFLGGL